MQTQRNGCQKQLDMSQNGAPFFPLKWPFWRQKKARHFETDILYIMNNNSKNGFGSYPCFPKRVSLQDAYGTQQDGSDSDDSDDDDDVIVTANPSTEPAGASATPVQTPVPPEAPRALNEVQPAVQPESSEAIASAALPETGATMSPAATPSKPTSESPSF